MGEHRTNVVVSGRTEGFQRVQQDATRLVRENLRAIRDQTRGFEDLSRGTQVFDQDLKSLKQRLSEIAQEQLATVRAMEAIDSGTQGYANLAQELDNLERASAGVERQVRLTERAFRDQSRTSREAALSARDVARYGFSQGLMQGVAPQFQGLQRGPGMQRQMAGMAVGTGMRSFASLPFTGVAGLQQGLAGVGQAISPLAAGMGAAVGVPMQLMSMGLGMGTQMAGTAIARDQARLSAFTQLGIGPSALEGIQRAGRITPAMRARAAQARSRAMSEPINPERAAIQAAVPAPSSDPSFIDKVIGAAKFAAKMSPLDMYKMAKAQDKVDSEKEVLGTDPAILRRRGDRAERRSLRSQQAAKRAKARSSVFSDIRSAGQSLMGLSETEAIQFATQIAQVGGGGLEDLKQQGLLRGGMAVQQAYGVGPGATGAFLQAGRVGGGVGAKGRGGDALAEAIGASVAMGLEGSDLNEFLAQMASGITAWKDTGIPLNVSSIGKLGGVLSEAGLGGIRGGRMAMGLQRGAQAILDEGPQSFEQLQMLRHFGGLEQGAGVEGYEKALLRLESGEGITAENVQKMLGSFRSAGGGGAGGRLYTRAALRKLGVNLGVEDTQKLESGLFGKEGQAPEDVLANIQGQLGARQKAAPQSMKDIEGQTNTLMREFGRTQRRMADVTNKQADAGDRFKAITMDLQLTTANVTKSLGDLTAPIKILTKAMSGLSDKMPKLTGELRGYLQGGLGSE